MKAVNLSEMVEICKSKKVQWRMGISLLAMMIFIIFVIQRKNYLSDNMHRYHVDEIHTVRMALMPDIPTYRVGESNRWLARALTPMALIYMNRNLGSYRQHFGVPGLNYYTNNFNQVEMGEKGITDPGLQDFYYSMRVQYAILFALCLFLFFLFYCHKEKDFFVPVVMTIYLGGSKHLLEEQGIFYAEPFLFMMFILGCFFLYSGTQQGHISDYAKKVPLLAFWYVLSVSVKISAVFLIFIPFVIIFYEKYPLHKKIQKCFNFFGYMGLFFVLIHITAFVHEARINRLVQGFTVNFWNYNSAIVGMDFASGWSYVDKIFSLIKNDFGLLFYLFIPAVLISFFVVPQRYKIIKGTLLAILVLSLFSISQQMLFIKRNIIPFYSLFLFLVLSSVWDICQKCKEKYFSKYAKLVVPVVMVILSVDRFYALSRDTWGFYHTFDRTKENAITFFKKIKSANNESHSYSVGIDLNVRNHTLIENFSVSLFETFPDYVEQWKNRMSSNDSLVIVNRVDRNYFLTNSILPGRGFRLKKGEKHLYDGVKFKRFGNYFVFYRRDDI